MTLQAACIASFIALSAPAWGRTVDYSIPTTVTVTAKCQENPAVKDKWFSLLGQLRMPPKASVHISANQDMSVESVQVTYSGQRIGALSPAAIDSMQNQVAALASATGCHASWNTRQLQLAADI